MAQAMRQPEEMSGKKVETEHRFIPREQAKARLMPIVMDSLKEAGLELKKTTVFGLVNGLADLASGNEDSARTDFTMFASDAADQKELFGMLEEFAKHFREKISNKPSDSNYIPIGKVAAKKVQENHDLKVVTTFYSAVENKENNFEG